eukprot:comp12198_c0_seq1/m.6962 comp12198_c0_seq1/g.6962  ORF comp12198_c0_seq1/g.6962 comp12198_c0_seq1/m.6962 type:complete len:313 (-) comp12198_c0_seq1:565-1503(-)
MAGKNFETLCRQFYSKQDSTPMGNRHIESMDSDFLYHIGYSSKDDLKGMFGDVKFVVTGGSAGRMKGFAQMMVKELKYPISTGLGLVDISGNPDRFSMYKVGPVLCVSHGMGMPSMSIMLHEITKLLHYAGCTGACIIRMGTSGGLGVEPGSLVITKQPLNGELEPYYKAVVLGEEIKRESYMDQELGDLIEAAWDEPNVPVIRGNTVATDDFYEGQGRLDGALCEYDEAKKMAYLKKAHDKGVTNIEMECVMFGAFCHRAKVPCAMVAVTLLNRLLGDQVPASKEMMAEYYDRIQRLLAKFIRKTVALGVF